MTTTTLDESASLTRSVAWRLPLDDWPRAVVESAYDGSHGVLRLGDESVLRWHGAAALDRGVEGRLGGGETIALVRTGEGDAARWALTVDGRAALREDELGMAPSRSAWIHGAIGLAASAAGFAAGALYMHKGVVDVWANKMGTHTAAWHLLLTFTMLPASVWGQRIGIRIAQFTSAVFFLIHVGIALANWGVPDSPHDWAIGLANAISGVLFLASVFYGQRAHRDMDPIAALKQRAAANHSRTMR